MLIVRYNISSVLRIVQGLLFFRALLSWLPRNSENVITSFIYRLTEPILYPIRQALMRSEKLRSLPIDLSLLIAFFGLELIASLIY